MKILVAGGTGFLGRPLADVLSKAGHQVVILTRQVPPPDSSRLRFVPWTPGVRDRWITELESCDVVINLAGASIGDHRWSTQQKQVILESRLQATRTLVDAIRTSAHQPSVFLSASAVGYYGPRGDEPIGEEQPAGADFLAEVCRQWEAEAGRAASLTRVVLLRTGLVLDRTGGALPRMLLPFRLGLGGPLGSGRQYWPWIHRADWIALVHWSLVTPEAVGPLNVSAPNPVTNRAFATLLGAALRRPSFMPAPAFALRLILGEMADGLLLSGQRALPLKAERLGFTFRFAELDDALRDLFA
jgi:uncharacterized protein (TIGR01777 family)